LLEHLGDGQLIEVGRQQVLHLLLEIRDRKPVDGLERIVGLTQDSYCQAGLRYQSLKLSIDGG
jgi:hypothetical protein